MKPTLEPFYLRLGESIQKLREKRGLSQEKLGQLLSPRMTRASVANIEGGKQRVLAHTLWLIAKVLDVSPEDLVEPRTKPFALSAIEEELTQKLSIKKGAIRRIVSKMAQRTAK